VADYTLRLTFDDGSERVVDLAEDLWGPMGEPLRDPGYFRQVRVDPELRTVAWANNRSLVAASSEDGRGKSWRRVVDQTACNLRDVG
jgi:hypothetical protein